MTHSFKHIKENITTCIEQVKSFGKLSEEQLNKLQYKFRLEWNYNSNSMEGNTLTKAETRSVMIGNLDVHRKPIKDVFELNNELYVLELNPRFGGGYPFSHEAGMDTASAYIAWAKGEFDVEQFNNYKAGVLFSKCDRLLKID